MAESVVLEREAESTLVFAEGASRAYAGHMTLKFSPDATSTMQHHKHYCLEVSDNCSPTIDHCIIRSASVGKSLPIRTPGFGFKVPIQRVTSIMKHLKLTA